MKAIFIQKNHGSLEKPKFTSLSAAMCQGDMGGHGVPPQGLGAQMHQAGEQIHPMKPRKLQDLMGQ